MKHRIKSLCIMICVVLLISFGLIKYISWTKSVTEYEYQLSEISDGVYGSYCKVVSPIPAENYEMITLCCNNQIVSFDGRVNIIYSDTEPHAIYQKHVYVHEDEIDVYVPSGTIVLQKNVGVG